MALVSFWVFGASVARMRALLLKFFWVYSLRFGLLCLGPGGLHPVQGRRLQACPVAAELEYITCDPLLALWSSHGNGQSDVKSCGRRHLAKLSRRST